MASWQESYDLSVAAEQEKIDADPISPASEIAWQAVGSVSLVAALVGVIAAVVRRLKRSKA